MHLFSNIRVAGLNTLEEKLMLQILETLFKSSASSKADITVGELQEIVSKYNRLLEEHKAIKKELKVKEVELASAKQATQLRVDANYSGTDADGVVNIKPAELLAMDLEGDVSISAKDLCGIITDRNRYHGLVIKDSITLAEVNGKLSKANKSIDLLRSELTNMSIINRTTVNLHGLADALGNNLNELV